MPTSAPRPDASDLWASLPSELASLLRPEMHSLATQILTEIQHRIPEYARPLDEKYARGIRRGVEEALGQFLDQIADPSAPQERCAEVHRALGRAEMREGRSLDSLQAAYRIGARLAWRRTASVGERARVSARTMVLLGEAIYAHIDALSALSVEGYAEAQAHAAGTRARRRRRLLELLLSTPQPALDDAAAAAQWKLPSTVTVAALERRGDGDASTSPLADWDALVDLECAEPHLLISSDNGEHDAIDWRLDGWRVAVGPPVALHEAPNSLRWARRVLEMGRTGMLPADQVTRCRAHLSSLLLLNDESLSLELIKERLAPLDRLKRKQQVRLARTLLVWLQTRGGAPEMAQRLGVHPQTVRYRLHQLEDLFGDALNDPDARFEMELGLRAARLLLKAPAADGQTLDRTRGPGTAVSGDTPRGHRSALR